MLLESDTINEWTNIYSPLLSLGPVDVTLLMNDIKTLGDLLNCDIEKLLEIDGITLVTIATIRKKLNELGYHLEGEDIVSYTDYLDRERKEPLKCCDVIIKKKREVKARIAEIKNEIQSSKYFVFKEKRVKELQNYFMELSNLEYELDGALEILLNYVHEKREKSSSLK